MTRTDIINTLLSKRDRPWYLEIGTADGGNFEAVRAHFKVGVDPAPNARGVSYRGTSDSFFELPEFGPFKWDVVFIDGLHHAEQAWRDVWNASKRLRPGGYIVMHDCLPPAEIFAGREPYVEGGPWNGDVYKAAVQAAEWFGGAFCVDADEGCMVLPYQKPSTVPLPNKLFPFGGEMEFDEFDEHRDDLLNIITPDEFKAMHEEKADVSLATREA